MKTVKILLFLVISFHAMGQGVRERRGLKYFNTYAFHEAIEQWEPIKDKPMAMNRMLAQAYTNIEDFSNAEKYWAMVVAPDTAKAEDIWHYCEVLKINGKHQDALSWMEKFAAKSNGDSRAALALANKSYVDQILADKSRFKVVNLELNSEQQDFGVAYYGNQILFASSREGVKPVDRKWNWNGLPFLDLYVADADSTGQAKNAKPFSTAINKKYHEGPAVFNADTTMIFYTRSNYEGKDAEGVVKLKLYVAAKKDGKWSEAIAFPYNSDAYSVGHASVTADGNTLYFASDMPGGIGGIDIYKSVKGADGTWGKPENLGVGINTEGNEMFPFYHEDGMLFFASNGLPGLGGLDVFMTRQEKGGWSKPMNLGSSMNSTYDDFSFVLSKDAMTGYFASNKPGGKGSDDLYFFNVLEPFKQMKLLKGKTKDTESNLLAETKVYLYDAQNNLIDSTLSDAEGNYQFKIPSEGKFKVKGTKEAYREDEKTVDAESIKDDSTTDLMLKKLPEISFYFLLTDEKTGAKVSGAKVSILEVKSKINSSFITSEKGDFYSDLENRKVGDKIDYKLTIEKEGYFPKTVSVTIDFNRKGQYNLHEMVDVEVHKVVKDISEMVDIHPIKFDLNKFNIRPDAAVELDKIVQVMNDYPTMVVELGSHTDCRASAAYNQKLSNQRAISSAEYIKQRITNPERIYGKGYGESQLKNKCECEGSTAVPCTEEEHAENRRTEFKIIKF